MILIRYNIGKTRYGTDFGGELVSTVFFFSSMGIVGDFLARSGSLATCWADALLLVIQAFEAAVTAFRATSIGSSR